MRFAPTPAHDAAPSHGSNSFGDLPDWDLSDLYTGEDAPELDRDMGDVQTAVVGFEAAYKGNLAALSAEQIGRASCRERVCVPV